MGINLRAVYPNFNLTGGPRPLVEEIKKEYPNGSFLKAQLFGFGSHSQGYIDIMPSKEAREYMEALASEAKYNAFREIYTEEQVKEIALTIYRPPSRWFTWEDLKKFIEDVDVQDPIREIKKIVEDYQKQSINNFYKHL